VGAQNDDTWRKKSLVTECPSQASKEMKKLPRLNNGTRIHIWNDEDEQRTRK
jgi:hypothetical protein